MVSHGSTQKVMKRSNEHTIFMYNVRDEVQIIVRYMIVDSSTEDW